MKYAEFNINTWKIEFYNSLLGNEKVLVNGAEVSSRFSFFGTPHHFVLEQGNFTLGSSFKAFGKRELDLKLEKNQKLVENLNIDLNPNYKIYWGALVIIWGIILMNYLVE